MKKLKGFECASQSRQGGFSTLATLSLLVLLGAGGYVGIRLVPSYLDYRVITNAVDEAAKVDSVESLRSKQVIALVRRKMGPSATAPDIDLDTITRVFTRDGLKVIEINYEVVVPVVKNASALIHYVHEATVKPYANLAQRKSIEGRRLVAAK